MAESEDHATPGRPDRAQELARTESPAEAGLGCRLVSTAVVLAPRFLGYRRHGERGLGTATCPPSSAIAAAARITCLLQLKDSYVSFSSII